MVSTGTRGFVRFAKGGAVVRRRVSPGAKKTSLKGLYGEDTVKLSIVAPPVDGKANSEAERFLAGLLEVPPSDVVVVHGASSRDKSLLVSGRDAGDVLGCLEPLL